MALVKWNKNLPVMWPSFFDDTFDWPELSDNTKMDIYETDEAIVVKADIPGIPEDNVDVTVEGNVLTITANYEESKEEKEKRRTVYKSSRRTSFSYSASLPRIVDSTKAEAQIENGVITITVPKSEGELPKKIAVTKK